MDEISQYIQNSLELNLFFLRIMKEHAFFLQTGFTPKDQSLGAQADQLRRRFYVLLQSAVNLSKGYVTKEVLTSGELFTRYTEEAERQTQFFTGIRIDSAITVATYGVGGNATPPATMRPQVDALNKGAIDLTQELLKFKDRVLADVLACRMFTGIYPQIIDHLIHEARHYVASLQRMMAQDARYDAASLVNDQAFWDVIMAEHAQAIEGQLDLGERALKQTAGAFGRRFMALEQQAKAAQDELNNLGALSEQTEIATRSLRNFKASATEGILSCNIRSTIIPLLADHMLREANHYLRLLREGEALLDQPQDVRADETPG